MAYDPEDDICAGKHGGSATSIEAFKRITKSGRRVSKRILCHNYIIDCDIDGATQNEAVHHLQILQQTASARFSELKALGLIYETRKTRFTLDGNSPAWVCVDMEVGIRHGILPNYNPKYAAQYEAIMAKLRGER